MKTSLTLFYLLIEKYLIHKHLYDRHFCYVCFTQLNEGKYYQFILVDYFEKLTEISVCFQSGCEVT
jgi:hypothetical protein